MATISEEIVNRVCTERGLKKMGISSVPTWIDQNKQEGIELRITGVHSFWAKDGSRNYEEPASTHIAETIKMINEFDNGSAEKCKFADEETKEQCKTPDLTPDLFKKSDSELAYDDTKTALLPDFLTPALMTKWAKMSTTDRILLFQETPKDKIKSVAVGKDETGVIYAPYVEGNYMIKEANAAFLFDWYFADRIISVCPTGVSVTGTLYCWFTEYKKYLSRPADGYQELNKKVDVELAKKGATTDAIKKALSRFGFNSDVYSGEV